MNRLWVKLAFAFAVIALLTAGSIGFLANRSTANEFSAYTLMRQQAGQSPEDMHGAHESHMGAMEESFLDRVNQSIWLTAGAAGLAALLMGLFVARRITRPLARLNTGALALSTGKLDHRVSVDTRDELGQLALTFNEMAGSLQRAEQQRRELLADIAHELRTPLTVIDGTISAVTDGVLEANPENLAIIKEEVRALDTLIGDLRELSLAESGQLPLELEPTDLGDLLRRTAAGFAARAEAQRVNLQTVLPTALPELDADERRIGQVLGNLIGNALRYTPAGGSITLSAWPVEQNGYGEVEVSVADSGSGIAPEDLPYVFDRFYRADRSRARRTGGSGLGLAIAKGLVEMHGGRIWAESQPSVGTTIRFRLPLRKPGASASSINPRHLDA